MKSKTIISYVTTLLLGSLLTLIVVALFGGAALMSDAEIIEFYKTMFGETILTIASAVLCISVTVAALAREKN